MAAAELEPAAPGVGADAAAPVAASASPRPPQPPDAAEPAKAKGAKPAKAAKAAKDKGKKKQADDAGVDPRAPNVAAHPRAAHAVARAKSWGALAGFALGGYLSLPTHTVADAGLRALLAGIVAYVAVWAGALFVWRRVVMLELRARQHALIAGSTSAGPSEPRGRRQAGTTGGP